MYPLNRARISVLKERDNTTIDNDSDPSSGGEGELDSNSPCGTDGECSNKCSGGDGSSAGDGNPLGDDSLTLRMMLERRTFSVWKKNCFTLGVLKRDMIFLIQNTSIGFKTPP